MNRPDQCPHCGSLERHTPLYSDGRRYDPFERGAKLWDKFRCMECGYMWDFKIITIKEVA